MEGQSSSLQVYQLPLYLTYLLGVLVDPLYHPCSSPYNEGHAPSPLFISSMDYQTISIKVEFSCLPTLFLLAIRLIIFLLLLAKEIFVHLFFDVLDTIIILLLFSLAGVILYLSALIKYQIS